MDKVQPERVRLGERRGGQVKADGANAARSEGRMSRAGRDALILLEQRPVERQLRKVSEGVVVGDVEGDGRGLAGFELVAELDGRVDHLDVVILGAGMPETVHYTFDLEVADSRGGIELAELYWALVGYRAVLPFPEERAGNRVIGPDDVPARGVGAIVGRDRKSDG